MSTATELWRWLAVHPLWALLLIMLGGSMGVLLMAIMAVAGEDRAPEPMSPVADRLERMTTPRSLSVVSPVADRLERMAAPRPGPAIDPVDVV